MMWTKGLNFDPWDIVAFFTNAISTSTSPFDTVNADSQKADMSGFVDKQEICKVHCEFHLQTASGVEGNSSL